ncbi:DUF5082 domain-containing protein [Metabacillus sp. HB246100]
MSLADSLFSIQKTISHRSNQVDEKIERLTKAKNDLLDEQQLFLKEIKTIKEPDLGNEWQGQRAIDYDEEREEAYTILKDIGQNDFEDYQQKIENKINSLEMDRALLNVTSALAFEAGRLVDRGEDAMEELSDRISELRRRLF